MDNNKNFGKFIIDDTVYETIISDKFAQRKPYQPPNPKLLTAFIPGVIREIRVSEGQKIKIGDSLLILEAMKMKNNMKSSIDGVIKRINVIRDQKVAKNHLLIEFE